MEPKQASLRRAISAAYYSLFHLLIDDGARRITANPSLQPYVARSFQHTAVKDAANKVFAQSMKTPPWPAPLFTASIEPELIRVCNTFVDLQSLRHSADYNTAISFKRTKLLWQLAVLKLLTKTGLCLTHPTMQQSFSCSLPNYCPTDRHSRFLLLHRLALFNAAMDLTYYQRLLKR